MHMLRHQNIPGNDEPMPAPDLLKLFFEDPVGRAMAQQREPPIATECNEMKVTGFLITNKTFGHGSRILQVLTAFALVGRWEREVGVLGLPPFHDETVKGWGTRFSGVVKGGPPRPPAPYETGTDKAIQKK